MCILLLENCLEHDILYDFVNKTRYILYMIPRKIFDNMWTRYDYLSPDFIT